MIEIKSWWDGKILFSCETDSVKVAVETAVKARATLEGANLYRANLEGATLEGANLYRANLEGATLEGATLEGANLEGANLYRANLEGANLYRANLEGATLEGANLYGANLDGANLDGARLPTCETFETYLAETVPALLTAVGKRLEEVACEEHWNCHDWDNCPMAAAFDVHRIEDIPILFRPRAEQFVQLFDAKLIPLERVLKDGVQGSKFKVQSSGK